MLPPAEPAQPNLTGVSRVSDRRSRCEHIAGPGSASVGPAACGGRSEATPGACRCRVCRTAEADANTSPAREAPASGRQHAEAGAKRRPEHVEIELVRLLLVVNASASAVTARGRVVIQKALSADNDVTVAETNRRGHATRLAQGAANDGVDVVVCLGGDGTLNEIA